MKTDTGYGLLMTYAWLKIIFFIVTSLGSGCADVCCHTEFKHE
jgi:hypothetical protein